MTYDPNIPQPTDLLSDSQQDILDNFSRADAVMGINHYPFSNNESEAGKHKFVEPVEQSNIPTVSGTEETLYSRVINTRGELCMTRGGTGTQIQMTAYGNLPGDLPTIGTQGSTFLPGGLFITWGTVSAAFSGNTTGTVSFSGLGLPQFPNNCFGVWTTTTYTGSVSGAGEVSVRRSTVGTNGFSWTFNSNASNYNGFYWVAIGN